MKKLMIAAAIVCAAAFAQAATCSWTASNVYVPVATDPSQAQSNINPTSGNYATGLQIALYWVGNGNHLIDTYTVGSDGKATATLGTSTTDTIPAAMIAEMGTSYKPQYYFTATYTDDNGTYVWEGYSTAATSIGNLNSSKVSSTANFKNSAVGSWSYTPAPEPTSAMLLLLGMAGLALKRKRA